MHLNKCLEKRATETGLVDRELSIQKERLEAKTLELDEKKSLIEKLSLSLEEKRRTID
jgi:hypothetical protein